MSVSEMDRRAAITSARFAARRRLPLSACPYDSAGDGRNRALALLWARIYRRYRA